MIPRLAREHKIDARKFSATSHIYSILYAHFARTASLNETCDALRVHESEFLRARGATVPARNTFSNANRTRDPAMAEALYWEMLKHLKSICPEFAGRGHSGYLARMRRGIFAMDSTTMRLTLRSMDWASHRRRKAAAKCHMRLDVGTFLPSYVVVDQARSHDSTRAAALCGGLGKGDVVLGDRAYLDFSFLGDLNERGVFFVVRPKSDTKFKEVSRVPCEGKTILDAVVRPDGDKTKDSYEGELRMVTAIVKVDGVEREMTFITNNFEWSSRTIAELYRARWAIEIFFKELKQTLQLRDFIGTNESAVKWQTWIGLLAHLLMRFVRHLSEWAGSFSRCVGIVRAALWVKADMLGILKSYGTARGAHRPRAAAEQLYLWGFAQFSHNPVGQHG